MDNYLVSYTDEALQDMRDIYDYISVELKEPRIAAAQIKRIRDEVRSLNVFPKRYKAVDWEPWSKCGMHQMPVDNFIVFYIVSDDTNAVRIVRIFYGKRDIQGIVSRVGKQNLDAFVEARCISRDPDVTGYSSMEELKAALESDK